MPQFMKVAAASANKPIPSAYYDGISRMTRGSVDTSSNPVLKKLDQEISMYTAYMKKRASSDYSKPKEEAYSRPSNVLFDLWNKYEPLLPELYFQRKLIEMGEFLVSLQEYALADRQCFSRYLDSFGHIKVESIRDVPTFKRVFFPEGFEAQNADFTFRALMGKSMCLFEIIKCSDPQLQNTETISECLRLLNFLRLVTQVILPKDSLCWLVYNGTVHIYSVCRHLMAYGHSSRVLEYLLWAAMCMEASVPLLGKRYLVWRSTLYTAVCQCYYDCKMPSEAESFARRALNKVNELSQLESLSNESQSTTTQEIFRHSTVKMAIMVFKRSCFETRKKPKGILRPKARTNLKDILTLPWPRTPTEKLLVDMFEGSAAQFLCVLETLNDSNRRTLLTTPAAPDSEVEILDVYAELFMAAQEVLCGGAGNMIHQAGFLPNRQTGLSTLPGVNMSRSLAELIAAGHDGVPLECVVKLVKLAYCYEQWEVYSSIADGVRNYIQRLEDPSRHLAELKALEILAAMFKLNQSRKKKEEQQEAAEKEKDREPSKGRKREETGQEKKGEDMGSVMEKEKTHQSLTVKDGTKIHGVDELIGLAEVLSSITSHPSIVREEFDLDMLVDATLFLWNKTQVVFHKYQTGSLDNWKYLLKMETPNKWIYILEVVHRALAWSALSTVDSGLTSEVALRLALVLEASASRIQAAKSPSHRFSMGGDSDHDEPISLPKPRRKSQPQGGAASGFSPAHPGGGRGTEAESAATGDYRSQASSILDQPVREQLITARNILELGLKNISSARQTVALSDGKAIADISWSKELNKEVFADLEIHQQAAAQSELGKRLSSSGSHVSIKDQNTNTVWSTVKDLHMEMFFMYHRVCIKLLKLPAEFKPIPFKPFTRSTCSAIPPPSEPDPKSVQSRRIDVSYIANESELLDECRQSPLVRAMLLMQLALAEGYHSTANSKQRDLLNNAHQLILKAQAEERRVYTENSFNNQREAPMHCGKVPPPPLLLCRTENTMTFKPAPFQPQGGEKVAWYRIFARTAIGSNVKVRLNDYNIPGCGNEVPSFNCLFKVSGMEPFERYVFGVAAYTAEGTLIGGSIGLTSKPLLTSHPLPILVAWAYLSQVSYQTGHFPVAKEACQTLWEHFVTKPAEQESDFILDSSKRDFGVVQMRLNKQTLEVASPLLLRMFLTSIFIHVETITKEKNLFCDNLCDQGPTYKGQTTRLTECEKMVVAMELAGWLTETNLALQAVVQCYGLLAPILFWKIPSLPVVQILERCHVVLQEIPSSLRLRRPERITASVHHMTACITYYLAKVLRGWGQRALANKLNDIGRALLNLEEKSEAEMEKLSEGDHETSDDTGAKGMLTVAALKKKKAGKSSKSTVGKDEDVGGNSELKALEAHILRLSKQVDPFVYTVIGPVVSKPQQSQKVHYAQKQSDSRELYTVLREMATRHISLAQSEHELTGSEDPSILNAYIAYLPSRVAYKEVVKFKRRARYLEFFVQVVQKAIAEGFSETAIDWCEEALLWIAKRNELVVGSKAVVNKQLGAVVVAGEDPKKFAAAMVEYNKQKEITSPRGQGKPKPIGGTIGGGGIRRKPKYKLLGFHGNLTKEQKIAAEERQIEAVEKFVIHLPDAWKNSMRRKRFRKICCDENPWRSQLNIVLGLSHFGVFLNKLELREKVLGTRSSAVYSASFLDPEWFTLETAGTLVLGVDGGPSRPKHSPAGKAPLRILHEGSTLYLGEKAKSMRASTVLEKAAQAAVGGELPPAPVPYFVPSPEKPPGSAASMDENEEEEPEVEIDQDMTLLSSRVTKEALNNTFTHFKRAIVLAHREKQWILLQNAVYALWNASHTAYIRAFTSDTSDNTGLLTQDVLRSILWQPFYCATDHWLDMMLCLEKEGEQRGKREEVRGFSLSIGNVECENGGSSLRFEKYLDDQTALNLQFTRRLVLRTMEYLYYEEKWEKLVDIGLRFTAFSGNRYYDQVLPLVVLAQRKLKERLLQHGEMIPQPHFLQAEEDCGPVTPSVYTRQLQLYLSGRGVPAVDPKSKISRTITEINQFDPDSLARIRDAKKAQRMLSVPVDIDRTLQMYHGNLDKAQYSARSLRHSRRLLSLYLGGQQSASLDQVFGPMEFNQSLGFVPYTAEPQSSSAPELKDCLFLTEEEVQTMTLPTAHLPLVIESYEKTIDMLHATSRKSLTAQAMFELGNIHYHQKNVRGAYRWWSESLDMILGVDNALSNWRSAFGKADDISNALLQKCGLWGSLLGSVIASNISQYILTSDLGMRTECCFLSGFLFKSLFRSSLPHPSSDRDYALYDIGEGAEVSTLVPGIDLFSDRFRADGRSILSALRWVTEELSRGRYNLFVLPLLTLYQYFATYVCRDLQRSVDGRILKVRVLTDLNLFSEACTVLLRLLYGDRLPLAGDSNFRQMDSKMPFAHFDASKPINETSNAKMLEILIDRKLSPALSSLYGPNLTCQLTVAHAHLLTSIAATAPLIVESETPIKTMQRNKTIGTISNKGIELRIPPPHPGGSQASQKGQSEGKERLTSPRNKKVEVLVSEEDPVVPLANLKKSLLKGSEKMLCNLKDALMETTSKGTESLAPMELELLILCKLGLSRIALQRHHSVMAVQESTTAMKLLQNSNIFHPPPKKPDYHPRPSTMKGGRFESKKYGGNVKVTDHQGSQFAFQNFEARSRLDARLWLLCRLNLVKSVLTQIKGMGFIKGPVTKVVVEPGDCRSYCAEGVAEAEACGDVEMQAEFLLLGAQMNIIEGLSLEHTRPILEEVLNLLTGMKQLSVSGRLLYTLALIQIADFDSLTMKTEDRMTLHNTLSIYLDAHESLLNQMQDLGETIIRYKPETRKVHFSSPVSPLNNLHLSHIAFLAQVKLRIGQAISRKVFLDPDREDSVLVDQYTDSLSILTTALEMAKVCESCPSHVEAEIHVTIGRVQRQLANLGHLPHGVPINSFLDAIKLSYYLNHDLGLIRIAYLEIALSYLKSSPVESYQAPPGDAESVRETDEAESGTGSRASSSTTANLQSSATNKGRVRKNPVKPRGSKSKADQPAVVNTGVDSATRANQQVMAAYLALHCASRTAQAQSNLSKIRGETGHVAKTLEEEEWKDTPQFACCDMMGNYVIGEKRIQYASWIEQELALLPDNVADKKLPTYEEEIMSVLIESKDLTWIHYLGYHSILQRLSNQATATLISSNKEPDQEDRFGLTGVNSVRYPLFCSPWILRTASLHKFFTAHLPIYNERCLAPYPPQSLQPAAIDPSWTLALTTVTYTNNLTHLLPAVPVPTVLPGLPKTASLTELEERKITPVDSDFSMFWYTPSLQSETLAGDYCLLYAVTKKESWKKELQKTCKHLWVPKAVVENAHDKFLEFVKKAELTVLVEPKPKQRKEPIISAGASPSGTPTPQPPTGTASSATSAKSRGRASTPKQVSLSPRIKVEEGFEADIREGLLLIKQVLSPGNQTSPESGAVAAGEEIKEDPTEPQEIPFSVTRGNIRVLEQALNPSFGCSIPGGKMYNWITSLLPPASKPSS